MSTLCKIIAFVFFLVPISAPIISAKVLRIEMRKASATLSLT